MITCQYTDAETGFVYLRARYYDPATGQFVSRDPAYNLTLSRYGYADGDPLNQTDPTGLDRKLTKREVKHVEDALGEDVHDIKGGKGASKRDLYVDDERNVVVKPKGGKDQGQHSEVRPFSEPFRAPVPQPGLCLSKNLTATWLPSPDATGMTATMWPYAVDWRAPLRMRWTKEVVPVVVELEVAVPRSMPAWW